MTHRSPLFPSSQPHRTSPAPNQVVHVFPYFHPTRLSLRILSLYMHRASYDAHVQGIFQVVPSLAEGVQNPKNVRTIWVRRAGRRVWKDEAFEKIYICKQYINFSVGVGCDENDDSYSRWRVDIGWVQYFLERVCLPVAYKISDLRNITNFHRRLSRRWVTTNQRFFFVVFFCCQQTLNTIKRQPLKRLIYSLAVAPWLPQEKKKWFKAHGLIVSLRKKWLCSGGTNCTCTCAVYVCGCVYFRLVHKSRNHLANEPNEWFSWVRVFGFVFID